MVRMLPANGDAEPLWTAAQIARYLNIPDARVRTLARRHGLPAFDVGGDVRVRHSDFLTWLEGQKISS